eukprot:1182240-Prorocentrum_minimum.AAC.3
MVIEALAETLAAKKAAKQKRKLAALAGEDGARCAFWLEKKKKTCNFQAAPGSKYCGNHNPEARRVPCPVDPKQCVPNCCICCACDNSFQMCRILRRRALLFVSGSALTLWSFKQIHVSVYGRLIAIGEGLSFKLLICGTED